MTQYDPYRSFGFLLHDIARLLRKNFTRRVQDLGLTQTQWQALAHLSRNEGIRQVTLAEILEIQPISLARLVDRLEAAGWVERRADPTDRRAFQLFLTERAKPLLEQMWKTARQIREEAMAGLSAHDQAQMIEALCAIKTNLMHMDRPAAGEDAGAASVTGQDRQAGN
ncbi:MAG TPA: MarR family transcriptional regulator [Pseudodesulfovibrio sp.]|nr:MarR family transcriptional regulator [Pseudodesulfovibrio sp.]